MSGTPVCFADVSKLWDVIVVGAGPAGAMAARQLANQNLTVLLLDRFSFPRSKVCGACLNSDALAMLAREGLSGKVESLHGTTIHEMLLAAGGRTAHLALPTGLAISRGQLDAALVQSAKDAGAQFFDQCQVIKTDLQGKTRTLTVRHLDGEQPLSAKIVIWATGLQSGISLSTAESKGDAKILCPAATNSKIGIGATIQDKECDYRPGIIYMAIATTGYVGLTRVENGLLNIASAIDPDHLRYSKSPGDSISDILNGTKLPPIDLESAVWHGTLPLTRRASRVAAERLFLIGDSAGYVEPFSGQGMAWAIRSAIEVAPIVQLAVEQWSLDYCDQWQTQFSRLILTKQRSSRWIAAALRRPALVALSLQALQYAPGLANPIIRHFSNPKASHTWA